jgi:hypothetical protein
MARSSFFALVPALKNANSALIQHEAARRCQVPLLATMKRENRRHSAGFINWKRALLEISLNKPER